MLSCSSTHNNSQIITTSLSLLAAHNILNIYLRVSNQLFPYLLILLMIKWFYVATSTLFVHNTLNYFLIEGQNPLHQTDQSIYNLLVLSIADPTIFWAIFMFAF